MKTAICMPDAMRDTLCSKCRDKVEKGEISERDVRLSRMLARLSNKHIFPDVEFHRSMDLGKTLVLLCEGNVNCISSNKRVLRDMEKVLGKKIAVVEKTKDEKRLARSFFPYARILGVNRVFTPEGARTRIIVNRKDSSKVSGRKDAERTMGQLLGSRIEITFG